MRESDPTLPRHGTDPTQVQHLTFEGKPFVWVLKSWALPLVR
jgi:hypothetical protein